MTHGPTIAVLLRARSLRQVREAALEISGLAKDLFHTHEGIYAIALCDRIAGRAMALRERLKRVVQ